MQQVYDEFDILMNFSDNKAVTMSPSVITNKNVHLLLLDATDVHAAVISTVRHSQWLGYGNKMCVSCQ